MAGNPNLDVKRDVFTANIILLIVHGKAGLIFDLKVVKVEVQQLIILCKIEIIYLLRKYVVRFMVVNRLKTMAMCANLYIFYIIDNSYFNKKKQMVYA